MTRIMWRNPTAGSRTLQMLFPVVHSVSWSGRHNVFANSVMHLMQDKAAAMTTCFAIGINAKSPELLTQGLFVWLLCSLLLRAYREFTRL